MAPIEPRDVDEDKLEDLLTTIPLLRSSTGPPLEVTVVANKPNAIVRPIQRVVPVKDNPAPVQLPPVQNDSLAALEAQIQRQENHSGYADSKRYPTSSVNVNPKRKLVPMDPHLHKPLFITTVPSGVFLEKTLLAEPRKVYNYCSAPRVLKSSSNGETQAVSSCLTTKKSYLANSQKGFR